jgi:hypothetical protein
MPFPDASMSSWTTLSAVGVIALASFPVSWLLTDVVRLPRAVYLAVLMVVTGSLTDGYLAWSGTDAAAFWSFVQVRREQIDNPAPAAILQGWRSARSPLEQSWQVGDAVDDRIRLDLCA